jgi:O-methyltransferase
VASEAKTWRSSFEIFIGAQHSLAPVGLKDFAVSSLRGLLSTPTALRVCYPDFDAETLALLGRVMPYTMTSPARIVAVCTAVKYVEANDIPGAFVECGVWKGGSSMAAALSFKMPRPLYLFDTFEGMSAPGVYDRHSGSGRSATELFARAHAGATLFCNSPLDEVKHNMGTTGYPANCVRYVKGKVEDTVPNSAPEQIAVLRLDTDWYESTRHELEHLYPRLAPGGVLIIDDYGYWTGARKAVDEYFRGSLFLSRIDSTGRVAVKPR